MKSVKLAIRQLLAPGCLSFFITAFINFAHAKPHGDAEIELPGGSAAIFLVTLAVVAVSLLVKAIVGSSKDNKTSGVQDGSKSIAEKVLLSFVSSRASAPQDVDVSVFAPPAAPPNEDVLVQVLFHTPERGDEALSRATKVDPSAKILASVPLTVQAHQNDLIKATLECDGVIIPERIQTTNWNGRLVCLYFSIKTPDVKETLRLRPTMRVFVNGIPAGRIVFKLLVSPDMPKFPPSCAHDEVHTFRRPFLSYASEDRVHVLRAAQLIGALKMNFFQDVLTLSPGDQWEQQLYSEIDQCDVFLLFWSRAASASTWVIKEAEYALQLAKAAPPEKRLDIVPILLEGPPPPPPPPSLRELHFNDPIRYVIFGEECTRGSLVSALKHE
jgi:hypothetical protein